MTRDTDELRTAVVVGGASGIGEATCRLLARDGHHVVVADVSDPSPTVEAITKSGGRGVGRRVDLQALDSFEDFFDGLAAMPPLGAVVITAALMGPRVDIDKYRPEDWQRVLDVNLTGTFFMAQAAANRLAAVGGGRVVLFTSASGRSPVSTQTVPYNATKAAIPILVHDLSLAYRRAGVLFAAIDPGRVMTAINRNGTPDPRLAPPPDGPMGRNLEPEEVAEVVCFLCSPRADGVTSAVWGVSTRP